MCIVMSEKDTYYVSSRGLMKACQFGFLFHPLANYHDMPLNLDLSQMQDGAVIYISAQNLNKYTLDRISCKVVIVTGDDDHTFPYSHFPEYSSTPGVNLRNPAYETADPRAIACPTAYPADASQWYSHADFTRFIESEKVIHCFIQNCAITHPKITKIPIGMDYHTFRNYGITPQQQEEYIMNLFNHTPPFWQRTPVCYGNFQFSYRGSKFGYDRVDAMDKISRDLIAYEPSYAAKDQCYSHQCTFSFVISPHGNGLDCHRTWEALCLGCIPIVKTSALDGLWEQLPVLIVKDWSDITDDLLTRTIADFKDRHFATEKLTLQYWVRRIYAAADNIRSSSVR